MQRFEFYTLCFSNVPQTVDTGSSRETSKTPRQQVTKREDKLEPRLAQIPSLLFT